VVVTEEEDEGEDEEEDEEESEAGGHKLIEKTQDQTC